MIIYRPHRGGLAEAMAEAEEFDSIEDIKKHLVEKHKDAEFGEMFNQDDIVIGEERGADLRIGWYNVCYVYVKRYGKNYNDGLIIGMCATNYVGFEQSQRMCKEFLDGK